MSQTSVIAASLIIAFLVFITVRGELPCYLMILGISTSGKCNAGISGTITLSGSGPSGNITIGGQTIGIGTVPGVSKPM